METRVNELPPPRPTDAASDANAIEHALVRRVASRDRTAFEALYRAYYRRLMRFLFRITRRADLVEEILNDAMLVVWQKAESFHGDSRVSTWIFGIAYRKALKALERAGRARVLVGDQDLPKMAAPDNPIEEAELQDWLSNGLDYLSAEQRMVVESVYYLGLSYNDIAEIAGCPIGTVKTRMFHARRRLKDLLPPLLGSSGTRRGEASRK
jgi:RNA polymerase sigma-70 factor (ECF subfamily)